MNSDNRDQAMGSEGRGYGDLVDRLGEGSVVVEAAARRAGCDTYEATKNI